MKNKFFLISILILICDILSKWAASVKLAHGNSFDIIPGYLSFTLTHNSGVAFGFFSDGKSFLQPYLLVALAIVALVVIFIYSKRISSDRRLLQSALAVAMGGILGNLADRFYHGYVVDFIDCHIHETYYFPTFNIADSAITVGIALLLLDTIKNPERVKTTEQPTVDGG
jgi:signal peptidase II